MKNPRTGGRKRAAKPSLEPWQKWSTELPGSALVALKVRAAQERRPIREVLRDSILSYVKTEVAS